MLRTSVSNLRLVGSPISLGELEPQGFDSAPTPQTYWAAYKPKILSYDLRVVRWRIKPIFPVSQNAHPILHPTCEEMQSVVPASIGINTDSLSNPSKNLSKNLAVLPLPQPYSFQEEKNR